VTGLETIRRSGEYVLKTDGVWHRDNFPERDAMDVRLRGMILAAPTDERAGLRKKFLMEDGREVTLAYDPAADRWAKEAE
jgi:hypothetical protein